MLTTDDTRANYTKREIERAEAAAKLIRNIGHPSEAVAKKMLKAGTIERIKLTSRDIDNAVDIEGKSVPFLRGKSVRKRPLVARVPPIKRFRVSAQFHTDIFFVDEKPYLLSVLMPAGFGIVTSIDSRRGVSIKGAMAQQLSLTRSRGYVIDTIFVDAEKGLQKLKGIFEGVHVDVAGANQHVPVAEARVKLIKAVCRAVKAGVPWRIPPSKMIHLVFYSNHRINSVPSMSNEFAETPREIFWGTKLDYFKDLRVGFGDYCEVFNEDADNSMRERTVPAIALYPSGNAQGSWKFLSLDTMRVVTRDQYTELPTPPEIINIMNAEHDREVAPRVAGAPLPGDGGIRGDVPGADVVRGEGDIVEPQPVENFEPEPVAGACVADIKERIGLHITVRTALRSRGTAALESIIKELQQMIDKKVWSYQMPGKLSREERRKIITCSMFLKEKFDANGVFEKLKSRLVAHGNQQSKEGVKASSPTVDISSVFVLAAVAAYEQNRVFTIDIGGAFLEARMTGETVYLRLDKLMVQLLEEIDPASVPFVNDDGELIVKLDKALYGCLQASLLWYNRLSDVLVACGYEKNAVDPCVFSKGTGNSRCTLCVHVDDLLIVDATNYLTEELVLHLKNEFDDVKLNSGSTHSYLGMSFDFSVGGSVRLSMSHYIVTLLAEYEVTGFAVTPAEEWLFDVRDSELLSDAERESFHSAVAKLLFLSKRVRPDIQTAVSFLTTRVQKPDVDDKKKLGRVLKYLNKTKDLCMVLAPSCVDEVDVFVDASYGTHPDGKSHTGRVVSLGRSAPVAVSSTKQKIVTKSSTEAELVGLSDSVGDGIGVAELLRSLGFEVKPIRFHQDNMSTIRMAESGASASRRTRHINVRYFFIKERIDSGEIRVSYLPTEEMIADLLTKPIQGKLFVKLRDRLLGHIINDCGTDCALFLIAL